MIDEQLFLFCFGFFFSSASARRICRWDSRSRSAASWPDDAPLVSLLRPPTDTDKTKGQWEKKILKKLLSNTDFTHKSTCSISPFLYLNYTVMNRGILFLPQHHQGNDDDSCYDNPSNHKPDDGTFIGPYILSEKHLPVKKYK